jgi:hypothetical protein
MATNKRRLSVKEETIENIKDRENARKAIEAARERLQKKKKLESKKDDSPRPGHFRDPKIGKVDIDTRSPKMKVYHY